MMSFCGVALPLPTSELQKWLDVYLATDGVTDSEIDVWSPPGLGRLPVPAPPPARKVLLGVLTWPQTASSWATFFGVVNSSRLVDIREAVGDPVTPQDLVLDDGVNDPVTASMYLHSVRPLFQCGGLVDEELFLLELVDARFYHTLTAGTITSPSSWSDLYSQIGTVLGSTITPETVAADYGDPTTRWVLWDRYTPAILDATATSVGQRVVFGLDGAIATQYPDTAFASEDAQFGLYRKVAGGTFDAGDLRRVVPESVTVLCRDVSTGSEAEAPHSTVVTLASLALTDYDTSTGVVGKTATVFADFDYDGTNGTAFDTLATRAATDWYGWRLADLDVQFAGLVPWQPTGLDYQIEWTHTESLLGTRIQREPFNWQTTGNWNYVGTPSSDPSLLLVEVTVSNTPTGEHTVKRKTKGTPPAVTDYAGPVTFTKVLSTTGAVLPVGTLGYLDPIPDAAGYYWISPNAGYASATLPGLVSYSNQTKLGNWTVTNPPASGSLANAATITAGTGFDSIGIVQCGSATNQIIRTGNAINAGWMTNGYDPSTGTTNPSPVIVLEGINAYIKLPGQQTIISSGIGFQYSGNGSGLSGDTSGNLVAAAKEGLSLILYPTVIPAATQVQYAIYDYTGPFVRTGIWGTRTVKDGAGVSQTVTISGGIITDWTV